MGYGKLTKVMDPLSFDSRPTLRSPTLVLAFAGWSDAGASATTALRYLVDNLMGRKFASIDPEEFYDFYRQRPVVRLNDAKVREIHCRICLPRAGRLETDFIIAIGRTAHAGAPSLTMLRFARE